MRTEDVRQLKVHWTSPCDVLDKSTESRHLNVDSSWTEDGNICGLIRSCRSSMTTWYCTCAATSETFLKEEWLRILSLCVMCWNTWSLIGKWVIILWCTNSISYPCFSMTKWQTPRVDFGHTTTQEIQTPIAIAAHQRTKQAMQDSSNWRKEELWWNAHLFAMQRGALLVQAAANALSGGDWQQLWAPESDLLSCNVGSLIMTIQKQKAERTCSIFTAKHHFLSSKHWRMTRFVHWLSTNALQGSMGVPRHFGR